MNPRNKYSLRYNPDAVNSIKYPNEYNADAENVILYCRVNGDGQATTEVDLHTQRAKLMDYCKENDLNIVMEVMESKPATSPRLTRPYLKEAIIYCQKHKRQRVQLLFLTWDKFSENPEFIERYIRIIRKKLKLRINAIEFGGIISNPDATAWWLTNRA